MSDESMNLALDRLTEEIAEAIIFTLSATTSDPKQAITQLLRRYLAEAQEQEYDDALHSHDAEERDQQNRSACSCLPLAQRL